MLVVLLAPLWAIILYRYLYPVTGLSLIHILAAIMVKELAGGTVSSEVKDICAAPAQDFIVELSYEKVHSLVDKVIPLETIKSIVTLSLIHIWMTGIRD